jgi:hypothetical protein
MRSNALPLRQGVLLTSFNLNVSGLEQTPTFLPHKIIWFHLDAPSSHAGARKPQRVRHQNRKQIQIPSEISNRRKAESSEDSMKKAFLLIVVPVLLVALAFAQTPAPGSNTDQATIKGCLGGSDGNYTVVEDITGHIFKITTSNVDLKPHLNHDITLTGHKASGASSTPADNSLAVTEVKMISEHCAAAAAASAVPVTAPSETATTPAAPPAATAPDATVNALPETVSTPASDATAPAPATAPAATATAPATAATTPPADATAPALIVTTPAETPVTPPAAAAVPVATIKTPAKTASSPAAHPRKPSKTPAAATTTPAVTASTPAATAVVPVATDSPSTDSPSKEPVSTPAAVAPAPAPTPASSGWSLWLLIVAGVVVLVGGVMYPFVSRWRKQKSLEGTDAPNLSFNREASSAQNQSGQTKSDQGMSDRKGPRKAA